MEPHTIVFGVASALLLSLAILSLRAPTWPRPRPWRPPVSHLRRSLVLQTTELVILVAAVAGGAVTPGDLGWKGWPTWPAWALLISLLWIVPSMSDFLLRMGPAETLAGAREQCRLAVRMLACAIPRGARPQTLAWWDTYLFALAHVAFFYGAFVHLGTAVLGSPAVAVGMGAAWLLASLWRWPRPHKHWTLFLYALQCVLLFSPIGLGGVLLLTVLLSFFQPTHATSLRDLRRRIEYLRRRTAQPPGDGGSEGP